ncbi:MAG TPA: tripartite tricarboxylate transporter substrate binding protein [Burkholderiales bacterium]|jgi:tripartite-type tricarboxylate transporter receptor subunit TctC|nr:tripartite tricarboxylate transporter substrate binding protein [Burkholderiales bacterium]
MKKLLYVVLIYLLVGTANAQYPTKPLRLVVPFAPGGSTDIFARLIAERAQGLLGQPVVVENRAGAAGNIGAAEVARAAPDGYTLLMATTGVMAINNALYKNMTFDAAKDLEPVLFVASITNVLIVPPDFPAKSVAELIALAKKEPGKLSFASSGAGSSTHMSAELFKSLSGTDILHIPYKGSGQALPDLMSGRVSMMFENAPGAVSHIKAGKVRALAQTGSKRSPSMPDLPTVAESGVAGYESLSWSGIAVPAGTPRAVVERLNKDLNAVLATAEMRQKLAEQGAETIGGPPDAFAQHIRAEREKWSRLIREKNIVVN